jgi:hypothetical protein
MFRQPHFHNLRIFVLAVATDFWEEGAVGFSLTYPVMKFIGTYIPWDRCYDFKNIFTKQMVKNGIFG